MLKTHPRLGSERLRLRPYVAEDAIPLSERGGDPRVADTMLEWPHPFSQSNARSTIAAQAAAYQADRAIHFAVELREAPGLVGGLELAHLDRKHRCAELRFWIAADHWGRGLASEAAAAALHFAFDTLRMNRVAAQHLRRDEVSAAVLQKLGLREEGVLRERVEKFGVFEDVTLRAALARDVAALPRASSAAERPAAAHS